MDILQKQNTVHYSQEELILLQKPYNSCPQHKRRSLITFYADHEDNQCLKCIECLSTLQMKQYHLLPLINILEADEKTIFPNWPILGDLQIHKEIAYTTQRTTHEQEQQEKIKEYFKLLRTEIDHQITLKENKLLEKTKQIKNYNQQILRDYNIFSKKEQLKEILKDKKDDFQLQNSLLQNIIEETIKNQEQYKNCFLESLEHIKEQETLINFDIPIKIKERIIQEIDSIDFILIQDYQEIKIQDLDKNFEILKSKLKEQSSNEITNTELILKLINNRFNNISDELLNKLSQIIMKLEKYFDRFDLSKYKNEEILQREEDWLSEQQFKEIKYLASRLTQSQKVTRISQMIKDDNDDDDDQDSYKVILNSYNNYHCSIGLEEEENNPMLNSSQFRKAIKTDQTTPFQQSSSLLSNFQLIQQGESQKKKKNLEILSDLISNKLNFCSEQFITYLTDEFNQISSFIESLDFSNYLIPNKKPTTFNHLNEQQLSELNEILYEYQQQNERGSLQLEDGSNQKLDLNEIDMNSLLSILQNKSNYPSQDFLENCQKAIDRFPVLFNAVFLQAKIFAKGYNSPVNFSALTYDQIKNIEILVNKISQLNIQYGEQYMNHYQPIPSQKMSCHILQQLNGQYDHQIVAKLFKDYPILDIPLIEELGWEKQINMSFIKCNLEKSKELIIEETENQNTIIRQVNPLHGQVITEESLDSKVNYIFRCKVNKNIQCDGIVFGVIQTNNAQSQWISSEKDKCCFYTGSSDYGLNKIIKGQNLYRVRKDIDFIEIRICINKRLIYFADYPNYNNINQVNQNSINDRSIYNFGFNFCNPGKDYSIEITQVLTVDDFKFINFK